MKGCLIAMKVCLMITENYTFTGVIITIYCKVQASLPQQWFFVLIHTGHRM
jgi:hypothetical protein